MTRVTKKKFVRDEVTNDYDLPTKEQQIVRVVKSCGSNLHEVMTCDGKTFIASMPTKFRRNIWVRIADFVVIDPIVEGDKVKGEISRVLLEDQIRYYKKQGVWPGIFLHYRQIG
ncbi:probable RNA-binding protein EIF1AD [Caerostris extrusa]|uniref:Probable RNA-binding protein EIF1AD n=1 Tax=Caerostris extrusa TaxID=172846 RepID=A0AAV4SAI4_CAEEX|nr:probable RNA-binding protein EIF1AD [Caerostris extrusa]